MVIILGINVHLKTVRLRDLVLGAAICAALSNGCTQQALIEPDATVTELPFLSDVWQLTWIADSFWDNTDYSVDVQASVIDQIKMVTWSSDGEVSKSAAWLDCNVPSLERRRAIKKPGHTIEKEPGVYEHVPAVMEPYIEVIINSEGCGFLPPASNQTNPDIIRRKLWEFFELSERVKDDRHLAYMDSEGRPLAKFKLQKGV